MNQKNVCVVVLGDIGRSPRMQYHSLSLAKIGHKVDIVGYGETKAIAPLIAQPLVSFHYLPPYPNVPLPKFLNYIFKTIWQAISLLFTLLIIRRADTMLVQNPPAIPALIVCWFYTLLMKAKYIIDWHNYAFTIMALNVGNEHILVSLTKQIEHFIGKKAQSNFCVTNEMRKDLEENWGIKAVTLYDKPPEIFKSLTLKEQYEALSRLGKQYEELSPENLFFVDKEGDVEKKANCNGLLISSTSWTEDEDFSILLSALEDYESIFEQGNIDHLPNLICVITGKGPLKSYYSAKIAEFNWKHVKIITPWLEASDYPILLACADLGVCLHTSSSGFDLPMKVVDMFGCGLPVCAYKFKSLHELVKHEENSFVFETSGELSKQIQNWFKNENRDKYKNALKLFTESRWETNWAKIASKEFQ